MENLPILILIVPLILYIIWDQMKWNEIINERKKIYKDLKECLEDLNNSYKDLNKDLNNTLKK
jgi:hypothetical protein